MAFPLWQANLTPGETNSSDETLHLLIDILRYLFAHAVIMKTLLTILNESRFLGSVFSTLNILYLFPSKSGTDILGNNMRSHLVLFCFYVYVPSCRFHWPRGLRRGAASAGFLGLRVRNPPGVRMHVSFECCHVEVSAMDRSLAKRSHTECGLFECRREDSIVRKPSLTRGCRALR